MDIVTVEHYFTWSGSICAGRHSAVFPASFRVSGVTPGHPLVVGVTAVVVIQASGKINSNEDDDDDEHSCDTM